MPSRALLQAASHGDFITMLEMTDARHSTYCKKYNADFIPVIGGKPSYWRKCELLIDILPRYDQVLWLDADSVIVKDDFDLWNASGFGVAVCECYDSPTTRRHLNTGVMLVTRSDMTVDFLREWFKLSTHQYAGGFHDQSAFIDLMKERPHRDLLTILPNRFNCVTLHMAARDPFIRSFHGDGQRLAKMKALLDDLGAG